MKKFLSFLFCLFLLTANSFASTRAIQIELLLDGVINPTTSERVASGTAYFYSAGTTDAKNVWTEKEKTNAYTSYSLNGVGGVQLYGEGNYKIIIKDSDGATVQTFDNIRLEYPNYYIRTITAGTTAMLSEDDFILCNTTGGAITINALAAASWTRPLKIQRISGSSNITFDPNGSETIDGSATLTISSDAIVEIISDGSNLRSAGFRSSFADADNDTKIQVEESADEDTIRMDVGGVEKVVIDSADFIIENNNDVDGQEILELYSPSLTTGRSTELKIGVEDANYDCGVISFEYSGNGSSSNSIRLGIENALDTLIIDGNGKVGINGGPTSADLYVNGNVDVNGSINVDNLFLTASTSGNPIINVQNNNDDANGPELKIEKLSSTPADNDQLYRISSYGKDSGATTTMFAYMDILALDVTDANEAGGYKFTARVGGTYRNLLELKGYNGSVNQGEIILNEDGQDIDFRVEASGQANAFVVRGSDGQVTINGTALTATATELNNAADSIGVTIPRQVIVNIGDWNMDSDISTSVAHGLTLSKIIGVRALIRNDADDGKYPLDSTNNAFTEADGQISSIGSSNVVLRRLAGGNFDSTDFDSTSYNRGWIILDYID